MQKILFFSEYYVRILDLKLGDNPIQYGYYIFSLWVMTGWSP